MFISGIPGSFSTFEFGFQCGLPIDGTTVTWSFAPISSSVIDSFAQRNIADGHLAHNLD